MRRHDRAHSLADAPQNEPKELSPLPPIPAKADDLKAIRQAVEDAASVGGGLWLSYLFVLFYLAIAAGAVTHADLLLENPVKLPFLNIELPLVAFFLLAPLLFLITHAYTLVHFVMLAKKAVWFHDELYRQIPDSPENPRAAEIRTVLRRQLPSNIFVQFLAGPADIRDSGFGFLLKTIAWTTLVVGPIALLLLLQIQFLPYHDLRITWTHRVALFVDLMLIWWLWRKILGGRGDLLARRSWRSWAKTQPAFVAGAFAFLFSWTVATFPGEWQESHLPSLEIIPASEGPTSLHGWLFAGGVNSVTRGPTSLFSNTLVLPGFDIFDALKIDDPKKVEWKRFLFSLRGRHLERAVLTNANLTKVDLEGAFMAGAWLDDAQLQGASLIQAHLQGASLDGTFLWRARLDRSTPESISASDLHWGPEYASDRGKVLWAIPSYDTLRQAIERLVSDEALRKIVLERVSILDCQRTGDWLASCDPSNEPPAVVQNWKESIEGASVDKAAYARALSAILEKLVCSGGPERLHVLRGLLTSRRIERTGPEAPALVARFMSAGCPVSAALTEDDRARLRSIAKRDMPYRTVAPSKG